MREKLKNERAHYQKNKETLSTINVIIGVHIKCIVMRNNKIKKKIDGNLNVFKRQFQTLPNWFSSSTNPLKACFYNLRHHLLVDICVESVDKSLFRHVQKNCWAIFLCQ